MTTGFERDIEGCATCPCACPPECENFCVGLPWSEMEPGSYDLAVLHHQGADHRIRAGCSLAFRRQAKGQGHVLEILRAGRHRFLRVTRDRLRIARADFVDFARETEAARADGLAAASANAAWAAANLAIATRKGEQLT